MKCTYCGCVREATEGINNWPYCDIHHAMLLKVPIVDKVKGHESKYNIEQDVDFDAIDEMNLRKGRTYNKTDFED